MPYCGLKIVASQALQLNYWLYCKTQKSYQFDFRLELGIIKVLQISNA